MYKKYMQIDDILWTNPSMHTHIYYMTLYSYNINNMALIQVFAQKSISSNFTVPPTCTFVHGIYYTHMKTHLGLLDINIRQAVYTDTPKIESSSYLY